MDDLTEYVIQYMTARHYVDATPEESLAWVLSELGEVAEQMNLRSGKQWKRNNPENHPVDYDPSVIAQELGDVIMMVIRLGVSLGVDPVKAFKDKAARKLMVLDL